MKTKRLRQERQTLSHNVWPLLFYIFCFTVGALRCLDLSKHLSHRPQSLPNHVWVFWITDTVDPKHYTGINRQQMAKKSGMNRQNIQHRSVTACAWIHGSFSLCRLLAHLVDTASAHLWVISVKWCFSSLSDQRQSCMQVASGCGFAPQISCQK